MGGPPSSPLGGEPAGDKHESGVGLKFAASVRRALLSWEPVSDRIQTANSGPGWEISVLCTNRDFRCRGKRCFYEQINPVQESFWNGTLRMPAWVPITPCSNIWWGNMLLETGTTMMRGLRFFAASIASSLATHYSITGPNIGSVGCQLTDDVFLNRSTIMRLAVNLRVFF